MRGPPSHLSCWDAGFLHASDFWGGVVNLFFMTHFSLLAPGGVPLAGRMGLWVIHISPTLHGSPNPTEGFFFKEKLKKSISAQLWASNPCTELALY